jgi:preprotein translocase subunit SecG
MYVLLLTIHIAVCIGLIIAVLLQAGKGADIGAVFAARSQALVGSAAVDFIKKATLVMVVVFMLTSLTLGFFNLERPSKSIMSGKPAATQTAPAAPGAPSGTAVPQGAPTQTAPAAPAVPGK